MERFDAIDKMAQVMREFKQGKLESSSGNKVKDRKQAIAIALSERARVKRREKSERRDDRYLVYFGGRRTPVVASAETRSEAISKARERKKRGGDRVVSARVANAGEEKVIRSGKWVRSGPNGEAPGGSKLRGHGPKPKNV
jgi:hypothetical protein